MIDAKDAVFWVNSETKQIMVRPFKHGCPEDHGRLYGWGDPIGAAYSDWREASDSVRITLMLETIIDLAANGFDICDLLKAFFEVREFRALGSKSYPMSRALTKAIIGRRLEPNTMTFEELLVHYAE